MRWIHAFPKSISARWNTNRLIQDWNQTAEFISYNDYLHTSFEWMFVSTKSLHHGQDVMLKDHFLSKVGLNSEFSFLLNSLKCAVCPTIYLLLVRRWDEFTPFSRALVQNELQSGLSRIRNQATESFSCGVSLCGIVANILDCDIIVNTFKHQSIY